MTTVRGVMGVDLGGTKAFVRVANPDVVGGEPLFQKRYNCAEHGSLAEIVTKAASESGSTIVGIASAIAGPVYKGRVRLTNLQDWPEVTEGALAEALRINPEDAVIVNDMVGIGASFGALTRGDLFHFMGTAPINDEHPMRTVNKWALDAPGTGLGKGDIYMRDDGKIEISDSEGGHVRWAPANKLQLKLWEYIMKCKVEAGERPFISQETVLQGKALKLIYDFLREEFYMGGQEPPWLTKLFEQEDPSMVITKVATHQYNDPVLKDLTCEMAHQLYESILGSIAGDDLVRIKGGVVLGGGITPKILHSIAPENSTFHQALVGRDHPNIDPLVTQYPLVAITNQEAGVIGATEIAKPVNRGKFTVIMGNEVLEL